MRVRWNGARFLATIPLVDPLVHSADVPPASWSGRARTATLLCNGFPGALGVIFIPTRGKVTCMLCLAGSEGA